MSEVNTLKKDRNEIFDKNKLLKKEWKTFYILLVFFFFTLAYENWQYIKHIIWKYDTDKITCNIGIKSRVNVKILTVAQLKQYKNLLDKIKEDYSNYSENIASLQSKINKMEETIKSGNKTKEILTKQKNLLLNIWYDLNLINEKPTKNLTSFKRKLQKVLIKNGISPVNKFPVSNLSFEKKLALNISRAYRDIFYYVATPQNSGSKNNLINITTGSETILIDKSLINEKEKCEKNFEQGL